MDEVPFEGRDETVTGIGLAIYYPLLVAALVGLWRHRSRREVVIPVVALALVASIMFISASGTRYRAPLEPLIAILAASAFTPARRPEARPLPDPSITRRERDLVRT
jgi:hypothetical protein